MSDESNISSNRSNYDDEDESQISPPTYSVVEDSHGSLVNLELDVTWPARPKSGRHSMGEYLKRKAQKRQQKSRKKKDTSPKKKSPEQSSVEVEQPSSRYIGVQASSRVSEYLQPTQFVLYYRRPDYITSLDDLPVCFSLQLAYMSSRGKIYHFGIEQTYDREGRLWYVELGNNVQQPLFRTMKALINYYETFGVLRKNGSIEIFTLPES